MPIQSTILHDKRKLLTLIWPFVYQKMTSLFILSSILFITFSLTGCSDVKPIDFDFKNLVRNNKPNSYLVCPENYCSTRIDQVAPVYRMNVTTLMNAWQQMITLQPRTRLLSHAKPLSYQYVQYSRFFHFPDYIDVAFIPLTDKTSTLAIYSHSVYGHYDFGVNEKRVQSWIHDLVKSVN